MTQHRMAPLAVLVAGMALAACDSPPTSTPTPIQTPTAAPVVRVTRISLSPPPTLTAIGERAQLTLRAFYSDGTSRDVSAEATWTSSFPDVIQVVKGEAAALAYGATSVQARVEPFNASARVRATPPGTFAFLGGVREPGSGGLEGVRVSSASSGIETVTRSGGEFSIGALADQRLLFEKAGFENVDTQVEPADPYPWIPMQRVLRLAPGGSVQMRIAPNDMDYAIENQGPCGPCKLVRLVGAAGISVRVRVRWSSTPAVRLRLWTAEGAFDPTGPLEIVTDLLASSDDVGLYVGHPSSGQRPYVNVDVTATPLAPSSVSVSSTSPWLR